jgi:hypothetical protein
VDVNGDGQTDFCRAVGNNPEQSNSTMSCRLASGDRFAYSDITVDGIGFGQEGSRSWCDANGDGISDYCRTARLPSNSGLVIHAGLPNAPAPQLLHQYTDGLRASTIITYLPMTDSRVYSKRVNGSTEQGSGYPRQLLLQPAAPVVFETIAQRGDKTRLTGRSTYRYEELRTDTWGHGSRGFRTRIMVNQGNNTREQTWYFQGRGAVHGGGSIENDFREVGLVQSKRTTLLNGVPPAQDALNQSAWIRTAAVAARLALNTADTGSRATNEVSRVVNSLADTTTPLTAGQVGHPGHRYIGRSEIRAWDLNGADLPSKVTVTQQDPFGNVTRIEETTRSPNITQGDHVYTRTTVNTYRPPVIEPIAENWILGRLETATVTSAAPSADTQIALYGTSAGTAPLASAQTIAVHTVNLSGGAELVQTRTTSGAFSVSTTASVGTGGLAPFAFNWTRVNGTRFAVANAQTATPTFTLASLNEGESITETWRVTVTDATGRAVTRDVTVRFGWLRATISPSPAAASRVDTGSVSTTATAAASGGTAGYTFAWTPISANGITISNANTATATFTAATVAAGTTTTGTFRVTATDARSVVVSRDVTVNLTAQWPALVAGVTASTVSGSRVDTGAVSASATATASGGSGGYTYGWSAINANGISIVNGSSATASFTANVNAGQTVSGTFRVTVTDNRGVTAASGNVTVNLTAEWPPLGVNLSPPVTGATRVGAGAVSATTSATATGGSGGYTYSWADLTASGIAIAGANTASPTFSITLGAGEGRISTFRVTARDSRGIQSTADLRVEFSASFAPVTVSISPAPVSVTREGVGEVTATATAQPGGGSGGYSYSWVPVNAGAVLIGNTSAQTASFSFNANALNGEAASGVFRVRVTDSRGVTAEADVTVNLRANFPPVVAAVSPNPITGTVVGIGTASASATVSPSGGSGGGYSYSWTAINPNGINLRNPSSQTAGFDMNLTPGQTVSGTFRATVADSRGVTGFTDVTVTLNGDWTPLTEVQVFNLSASRDEAGDLSQTMTVLAAGGRPPYSWAWIPEVPNGITVTPAATTSGGPLSPVATFSRFLNAGEAVTGTFRISATDARGVTVTSAPFSVTKTSITTPPPSVTLNPMSISAFAPGGTTISRTASVQVTGGRAPFTYAWSRISGSTAFSVSGTDIGTFSATVPTPRCEGGEPFGGAIGATFQVVVTDSRGQTGSATIGATFQGTRNCSGGGIPR